MVPKLLEAAHMFLQDLPTCVVLHPKIFVGKHVDNASRSESLCFSEKDIYIICKVEFYQIGRTGEEIGH